ncbi:S1 family peptidase [Actinokineospora globicatena]|uniref:Serine protease n=1 Tax=Actinokineospora globicatena TaxID=103729 RepID=A0A9W6V8X9_9PSEU|nr:serine protease [Actinokineospora globicatena]MCP2305634.1 chymotrypsin, Serine peptidase, MEROPS family S01A [Actinokineospora globicatena]GLW81504.1 serine protease [Actinokineospora globicatena]GLW87798.1 serine protease [Actinokineospora globicatena]GLW94475.1 serine protease [Actinokineospora globicatena]
MGRYARRILGALAAVAILVALLGQIFRADASEQIVGGQRVPIADHPYVVYLATTNGFQFCGGTLTGRDKVVTAAHCAKAYPRERVVVVAGREDKQGAEGMTVAVKDIWVHPDYQDVTQGDDVAVLTLAERVPYRPLPLAADRAIYAQDAPAAILGWGRVSETGPASRYLLGAEVRLVSDAECSVDYDSFLDASMVCAGLPEGGIDTCQGDSGGPLVVDGRLVGISSWGQGCAEAGKPGVYTRVAAYADLIADHL